MATTELLNAAKLSARIKTNAYDTQIGALLDAAFLDMGIAGVQTPATLDKLIETAAITYFQMHFGEPDNYDRLKASYDEQKGQLTIATGYTNWGDSDGQI